MYSKNNNLALKYGFGVDQSQIGPNSKAYTTRMDALNLPDPVTNNAVAGSTVNNQKLGTSSDPRFNAVTQAATNVAGDPPQAKIVPMDLRVKPDQFTNAGGSGRHGSQAYWDWIDQSGGVGAQTEIHTIGSQHAADASIDAGWGQDYSVDVEAEQLPWYGRLPSGEGSGYDPSKPKPMPYDPNSNQRMMNTQYAQHKGRQLDQARDAAGRKIHGEGSYYSAGQPEKLYDQDRRDSEARQVDMLSGGTNMQDATNIDAAGFQDHPSNDPYQPKWGKEKVDLDRFASYDSGKRFSNEQVAENLAMDKRARRDEWKEVVESKYGAPTEGSSSGVSMDREMRLQALKGPKKPELDYDWLDFDDKAEMALDANEYEDMFGKKLDDLGDGAATFEDMSIDQDFATNAMGGGYEKGIGATLGEAWGKFDKTFESIGGGGTAIAAGAKVLGDILKSSKSQGLQEDLRGMKGQVESAVGSLANLKYAEQDAEKERFGEESRQAGGVENIALSDTLTKIREISQGGLSSGSKSRLIDKATDDSQTKTDIVIADSYDKHLDKMAGIQETSVSERSQLNEKLTEIDRQIADLDHSWMDTALDVGQIVATGMNPALGMAYAGARTLA